MGSKVVDALRLVVADTYAIIGQTHICHWNVRGASFFSLHTAFEEQYNELFAAVDEIAERIRAKGALAPCLLYTSPSPRDGLLSRMPSSA